MIVKTLFLHPLGPACVLSLAGLLLGVADRLTGWQAAQRQARLLAYGRLAWSLVAVAGAMAVMVILRLPPVHGGLRWVWQPLTVAGSALEWRLDGWNWLAGLLILLLTATVLLLDDTAATRTGGLLSDSRRTPASAMRTLWLGAAALAFVFSANVITLAVCALLLDGALALRLQPERSRDPAGRAWVFLSVTGWLLLSLLVLLAEDGIREPLTGGTFSGIELGLLWLVALIRAGVYPLHFWLIGSDQPAAQTSAVLSPDAVALHLIVPTTGLWLLGRVYEAAGPQWLHRPEWAALGALALLGTALVAWVAEDESWRWRWIALNRASLVVMAAYVAETAGPSALVWSLVTFSLGSALLAAGQAIRAHWNWRLPVWVAALALWGFPGTPGFLARTVLTLGVPTDPSLHSGQALAVAVPLFAIILIAETLLAAALWQAAVGGETATDTRPAGVVVVRLSLALGLLAAPVLAWGLAPVQLAALAGLRAGETFPALPWLLVHVRRSIWIGLILSGVAGAVLGLYRERIFAQMRGWQRGITAVVSLEWLYRAAGAGLALAGSGLQYFATLGEGEGYLGWLALAAVILWVLLRG
ncbi:MAG: hypothetical protein NT169_19340 [Chloroflexi bacterium]|nr:hypothetical protein [Chloroflexota bacterium]